MGFTILGTGSALPKRSVSNDELSEFLDTSDEWIFTRTGIKSRHVCTTESLDDLAVAASERALQVSGIDASQLDLIVCSTTTGDHLVPAEACAVAERLGATCPAFDVSAACAGFVFALDVAEGYIARGRRHALRTLDNHLRVGTGHINHHVDTVGQRTAQFRPIALDHRRRAAAWHLTVAQKTAGAGIARSEQLKARREGKAPVDAYDPHITAFDGLTQRLQYARGKLGKLVQK